MGLENFTQYFCSMNIEYVVECIRYSEFIGITYRCEPTVTKSIILDHQDGVPYNQRIQSISLCFRFHQHQPWQVPFLFFFCHVLYGMISLTEKGKYEAMEQASLMPLPCRAKQQNNIVFLCFLGSLSITVKSLNNTGQRKCIIFKLLWLQLYLYSLKNQFGQGRMEQGPGKLSSMWRQL